MAYTLFVHGLDNKPERTYLYNLWKRKLAHDGGIDLDEKGVESGMGYWANVLYATPDANLAAYESVHGEVEGLGTVPALRLSDLSEADIKPDVELSTHERRQRPRNGRPSCIGWVTAQGRNRKF